MKNTNIQKIACELFDSYENYKLLSISNCRFTQSEMLEWLKSIKADVLFKKSVIGNSAERREISLYTIGSGLTRVLLWSQMHGDEPTATMALCDIFNFFAHNQGNSIANKIKDELTLLIIPMLNPDGAQRFTRRTAQLIDINRDAISLKTPEARILKETHDKYKPAYGFNLHDQDSRLTVGFTKKITAIALLAPQIGEMCVDNPVRLKAKKVASLLIQVLNQFIPGYIAKWNETFEPLAFGDNFQKWGTSTILLESGGWKGDPNKFFLRKLNYVSLLSALYAIAEGIVNDVDISCYEKIPLNMELGCDYLIRNAIYKSDNSIPPVKLDVAINFDKKYDGESGNWIDVATIINVGDLQNYVALEQEVDVDGAQLDEKRIILDKPFPLSELTQLIKRS